MERLAICAALKDEPDPPWHGGPRVRSRFADRLALRIPSDEIGIRTRLDRPLASAQAEDASWTRAEKLDEPLERDPAPSPFCKNEWEPLFNASESVWKRPEIPRRDVGTVRLLGVIGADGVERSVGDPLPERLDVLSAAERRDNEETLGVRVEIHVRVEEEVVRAGFREDGLASVARRAHEVERACGRKMDEVDGRLRECSQGERAPDGFLLDAWRTSLDEGPDVLSPGRQELIDPGCDRATVLAVNLHEQSLPMSYTQGLVEDSVGGHQPELRVREEELDAPRAQPCELG